MADSNIVQFLSFSSSLAPFGMTKRTWKGLAEKYLEEGATRVINSQCIKKQVTAPQLKFISKNIWPLEKFTAANSELSKTTHWPVSVVDMGTFITALSDFKSLQTTKRITAEMITSSFDKCVIAVRAKSVEESVLEQYRLGDELRQLVNDILCNDYESFIGYVIYKRIDLNMDRADENEQGVYDWITEIYLDYKGSSEKYSAVEQSVQQLVRGGADVCYGLFKDDQCLPQLK